MRGWAQRTLPLSEISDGVVALTSYLQIEERELEAGARQPDLWSEVADVPSTLGRYRAPRWTRICVRSRSA